MFIKVPRSDTGYLVCATQLLSFYADSFETFQVLLFWSQFLINPQVVFFPGCEHSHSMIALFISMSIYRRYLVSAAAPLVYSVPFDSLQLFISLAAILCT